MRKLYGTIQGTIVEPLKLRIRKWLDLESKTGSGTLGRRGRCLRFRVKAF